MFACSFLLVASVACSDATRTDSADDAVVAVGAEVAVSTATDGPKVVELTPATGTIEVGATLKLIALGKYGNHVKSAAWTSSAPAVATVTSGGIVTGISAGVTTITASTINGSASARVTVGSGGSDAGTVASVKVSPEAPSLQPGATVQLSATASDAAGKAVTGKSVAWSSSSTSVATVSATGLVTAVAAGTATIRATVDGKSASAAVTVTPSAPSGGGGTPEPAPSGPVKGIWIGSSELAALPTSGAAWSNLKAQADRSCGTPDLSNQDQSNNVCIMAKALVFARTGTASYRTDVVAALRTIANAGAYDGRALALGRELASYVIAADLVNLAQHDPQLDAAFRTRLRQLLRAPTSGGPSNLVDCHETRANNWGTHCGASRAAVAAYLGDRAELDRTAKVFKGWLGDRSSYAGFKYGDLAWQCNPSAPVGINPRGCVKNGRVIDGVLPDDQRRTGGFAWPPPKGNYVWGALAGVVVQAVILQRQGYPAFEWQDRAILRAVQWLHQQADFPASGDDAWQPHVINRVYGTSFPEKVGISPGKNVGWTDWTH